MGSSLEFLTGNDTYLPLGARPVEIWGVIAAAVGGALVGGVLGGGGGSKPPKTEALAEAQKYAADKQFEAAQEALALLREQHEQGRADVAPWREVGLKALQEIDSLRDAGGHIYKPWKAPTAADLEMDPGYQFRLEQGERAIRRNMNATGGQSGATLKALQTFGQQEASQEYQAAYGRALTNYETNYNRAAMRYDRLAQMAGVGGTTSSQMAARGAQFAQAAGQNIRYGASALGAGEVGAQNALYHGQMMRFQHRLNARNQLFGTLGMLGGAAIGGYYGGIPGATLGAGFGGQAGRTFAYY